MANWRNLFTGSLRTKVLLPVILVMVLLLTATVLIVNHHFKQEVWGNAQRELTATKLRFQHEQIKHQRLLKLRFQSLAREPVYQAAFRTLNPKTISTQLGLMLENEMLSDESVVFVYFAPQNEAPADNASPIIQPPEQQINSLGITAGCYRAIQLARQGEAAIDTARLGDKLCTIVVIPIFNPLHDQIIGTLAFGEEMGWNVAQELSIGTGGQSCTALLADNRVIASTLPGTDLRHVNLTELYRQLARRTAETNATLKSVMLKDKHYFFTSGTFPSLKGNPSLGYLLFSSYEDHLTALTKTQQLLLTVSLLAIVIGSLVVWFFVQRTMAPLLELRDSAEAVGRGDFSRRVTVRSHDECGKLAMAFNHMTENVQQSQTQLQQTVLTLKNTRSQLVQSEKLSAIGEFVAGVAHELNNPLATVMGFSELLKDAPVEPKYRRHLEMVFKSAERCQKIVHSLLSFARRHQPERKPVAVNKLIEDVLEIVAYQLRTSNVEVAKCFSPALPSVLGDGHQIQQVLLNFINNARQAIEEHQASGEISITTKTIDGLVFISVQDNGPGISNENMQRIFDPFFTTKEVGKGTGLGLSLCYGLIKEHGGNITVSSQPGAGATFTIELPAAANPAAEASAPPAPRQADAQEGAGKSVLVVDDEEMLLELANDGLTQHGYDVITVNNGEAALRAVGQRKFDVIFCDLKMPGLNGRQIYTRLCTDHPQAARRLVFVTGDIINETLARFLEQEKITCLNKPFSLAALSEAAKKISSGGSGA